jgi:hypothetical protein
MKLFLARIPIGRMFLHIGCICRGGKVAFHWEGLRRELNQICRALTFSAKPRKSSRRK